MASYTLRYEMKLNLVTGLSKNVTTVLGYMYHTVSHIKEAGVQGGLLAIHEEDIKVDNKSHSTLNEKNGSLFKADNLACKEACEDLPVNQYENESDQVKMKTI